MNTIAERLEQVKATLYPGVKLIAVTKTHPAEIIMEAIKAGHNIFGENKVQELLAKKPQLPESCQWHMIGHLQTNKVKQIVGQVALIHGVDSFKLLKEISKEAQKKNVVANCLLQFHIAQEETKYGFSEDEVYQMLETPEFSNLTNICIKGVMGMATFTDDTALVRKEFAHLRKIFETLKTGYFRDSEDFKEISMGMSDDYRIAMEEGSTMVRIGSLIFGARNYAKN